MILPIRPIHFADESISGYFFRLLRLNGFHSPIPLLSLLKITNSQAKNNFFTVDSKVLLAKLINKDEQFFYTGKNQLSTLLDKKKYYTSLFLLNRIKYCPLCIKESYYHRELWISLLISVCPHHAVVLQDDCPNCKSKISMKSFFNGFCDKCFFAYINTSPQNQESKLFNKYQMQLSNILQDKGELNASNCNLVDYIELMLRSYHIISGGLDHLGTSVSSINSFYNRSNTKKDSRLIALTFANAMWMYDEFPKNYYEILDEFIVRNSKKELYEKLKRYEVIFNNESYNLIKETYQEFFLNKLNNGVVRKDFSVFKKNPELLLNRKFLRREEVKNLTRMTYGKISNLSNNNEIHLNQTSNGERKGYFVESNSLHVFLVKESLMITKKEAALLVGLHSSTINKLIEAKLLDVHSNYSQSKIIDRTQLNELVNNCLGQRVPSKPDNVVSFHEVLIKQSVNFLKVVDLIQFTLDGILHPIRISDDRKLTNNFYIEEEIDICLKNIKEKLSTERGITFQDLMRVLHIGEKRLWKVLKSNGIEADFTLIMKDGRKRYYFKKQTTEIIFKLLRRNA
ncbi:TniQ family protein [Paenibacillus sp. FSL H7-0716]|uniref:TniQ domain-containing protein n=1 Tax=Paenibacillus odorifer TaxID=189426 RepID=A0AB36JKI3_9BACL|nr:TniQ family protein [Paenibacillus odorifer]OME23577.1 hypothetical protein BSK47_03750 [Paenibacillus odorifer]